MNEYVSLFCGPLRTKPTRRNTLRNQHPGMFVLTPKPHHGSCTFDSFEKIPVSGETEALESLYLGKMERDKPDLLEAFFRLFLGY